ncbi:uncharacterized protein LOC127708382 [Mytilus californianus]|uniref:uncharacterized protein LOC127708382 n=1 Tax=Mytilus californianus TaxID=6549 RepID=UPI0022482E4F|nr:uncharacterized protein LOC127708382 [Mytilus californianus]
MVTCRGVGGKPPPNMKLLISGITVATGNQSIQYTLPKISRSYDRKTITCYAGNEEISHYPLVDSAKLYLTLKPISPIFDQKSVGTEETMPLNVSCTSHGSRPAANVTWLIGQTNMDVTINSSETKTFNSSTEMFTVISTLIYNVDRTYNGQMVTCKASNILSSNVSSSTLLNIKYAPSVKVENKTFQQTDKARNVQCRIQAQPVFAKGNDEKMIGVIGRSVDVNVYVFSEPKHTKIRWYKNTVLLKQSAKYNMTENMMIVNDNFHGREVQLDGYRLTLVINELRFEDAAVYKLQLSNGIGNLVEHNLILEIGHIPQTPTNITVVSVEETSLTIQWVHVDDIELHLMYQIEYKLSISSTWIHKEMISKETENTVNAIQSVSSSMVALGTSSTIITIVAWLVVGLFWFKRKSPIKTIRNKTDFLQQHLNTQMYDVVTDSTRIKTDQPRDISDTSKAAYEALGLKDKPNVYSEFK